MDKEIENMDFEKEKIELVKMRIENGYYNNENVLRKVVDQILNRGLKRKINNPKLF
ncbi:MAG: hypothetical protein JXR46_05550 [Calditrichaceae bacterium]|nr:hypothetical protein [Calditrichaceae bacterium]MBN2708491.1 hypothetical protein [Calditrichaceae bacterium]